MHVHAAVYYSNVKDTQVVFFEFINTIFKGNTQITDR